MKIMKIYVYVIWFPTGKRSNPYYIGIAKNLKRRMFQHISSNGLVGNALNKYNDWILKKLYTCKSYEEAFKLEIEEIRHYNCVAPNGYNLTKGGEGSTGCHFNHTDEAKEKMKNHFFTKEHRKKLSEALMGNRRAKGNSFNHTDEAKEKMRRAAMGNQNARKQPI